MEAHEYIWQTLIAMRVVSVKKRVGREQGLKVQLRTPCTYV